MSRSRTASFRRSVIQVVAAFAALPGCASELHGSGKDPKCDEGDPTGCAPVVECTKETPVAGTACLEGGKTCGYDECEPGPSAICVDGKWKLEQAEGCNPPYYVDEECPEQRPDTERGCFGDLVCAYDECDGADPISEARCVNGQWEVSDSSCKPRDWGDTECPAEPPAQGAACADTNLDCAYDSCTNARGVGSARCVDNAWDVDEGYSCNPPEPDYCPEAQPELASPCAPEAVYCAYTVDGTLVALECLDGEWNPACDGPGDDCPKPPGECPTEPPEAGKPCSVGESCGYYDCGGQPALTADCPAGIWEIDQIECNPPELDPGEE